MLAACVMKRIGGVSYMIRESLQCKPANSVNKCLHVCNIETAKKQIKLRPNISLSGDLILQIDHLSHSTAIDILFVK